MSTTKLRDALPDSRHFWFLMLNVAVMNLATTMLAPFYPVYFRESLGMSVAVISALFFASGILATFASFPMGWVADRLGRKKTYAVGVTNSFVTPVLLTRVTTPGQLLSLWSLSGVLDSAWRVTQQTIIADQVEPKKRDTAYGITRIIGNASWVVAPVLGGILLAGGTTYGGLFLISAVIGFVSLLLFVMLIPESRRAGLEKPTVPKLRILKDRDLLVLCVASMFSMLFYVQFYSLLPIFGREVLALDQVQVALLFSVSGATVVLLQFPTSFLVGRIPKRSGYVLGVVLMAVGITGIAFAPDFVSLLGTVVIMTIGENMFFPLAMALVAEMAPEAERGMYMGAFALFLYIGGNLSPLLGGIVWDLSGDPLLPWLLSPIYAAVTVLLALTLKPKRD